LDMRDHTVQIFKRTEWDKGSTLFYGFLLDDNAILLNSLQKPKRKIEFFGNSITCGYSIEDYVSDSPDGFYENNYEAYGAITARHFNAQYHCTSKSGIGVLVSWFPLIMPEMYDRLNPNDSNSKWDFSKYIPDVVVINLLQNDSWIIEMPENGEFKKKFGTKKPDQNFIVASYKKFVQTVRLKYPKAQIICMLGNMDITQKNSLWPLYVQKAVAEMNDNKTYTLFVPYKEIQGHPKTAEQKIMADTLIKFIEKNIKW
jgi:GDSL-like Lipase/Acylhydrolase family